MNFHYVTDEFPISTHHTFAHVSYKAIAERFAKEPAALDHHFAAAWYKLMSRDMGPHARCVGSLVPPAQPFQLALPAAAPAGSYDVAGVAAAVRGAIEEKPFRAALFARTALACATSFRHTDYQGGCNGALIRFTQSHTLPRNAPLHLGKSIAALAPIKDQFGAGLSWSDLIVLAGHVAIEASSGEGLPSFCPGRADALSFPHEVLQPSHSAFGFEASVKDAKEAQALMGLSAPEMVALSGAMHALAQPSAGDLAAECEGFLHDVAHLYSERCKLPSLGQGYFAALLAGDAKSTAGGDSAFVSDATYKSIVESFAASDGQPLFATALAGAWMKLANADRFDGPLKNVCDGYTPPAAALHVSAPTALGQTGHGSMAAVAVLAFGVGVMVGSKSLVRRLAAAPMQ